MAEKILHLLLQELSKDFPIASCSEAREVIEGSFDEDGKFFESAARLEGNEEFFGVYDLLRKHESQICDLTMAIRSEVLSSQQESNFRDNTWTLLVEKISIVRLQSLILFLVSLWKLNLYCESHRKLSFNTARMYITLLTIPGAKTFDVLDDRLVLDCLEMLNIVPELKSAESRIKFSGRDKTQIEVFLISFLEDLSHFLKHVSLNEHPDLQSGFVKQMKVVLQNYVESGYESVYSVNISRNVLDALEAFCLPIHGDASKSISLIFTSTMDLYGGKRAESSHRRGFSESLPEEESLFDFFLRLLKVYPNETYEVLNRFISSIVTNSSSFGTNKDKLLPIAVKFEVEMYRMSEKSLLPWLETCCWSNEVAIRTAAVEFLSKLLTSERFDDPQTSRQEQIMKILFEKCLDVNNGVKQKALSGLVEAFKSENGGVKALTSSTDENSAMNLEMKRFLDSLLHLLQNPGAYVRKSSIMLLEIMAANNERIIESDEFCNMVEALPDDGSVLVRRQSLALLNLLVEKFPENRKVVKLWTKCFLMLISDNEPKIVEFAMTSFQSQVFEKIASYENTTGGRTTLPWTIVGFMMEISKRKAVKKAFNEWTKSKPVSKKIISIIETHIYTSNSVAAWFLLSTIAQNSRSSNPDIIARFIAEGLKNHVYDSSILAHLMLEVTIHWISDFNKSTLDSIFQPLVGALKSGCLLATLISSVFNVCVVIQKLLKASSDWVLEVLSISRFSIFSARDEDCMDDRFLNQLLIFSEASTFLCTRPETEVTHLMATFMTSLANDSRGRFMQASNKLCVLATVLTRFSIRDIEIATAVVPTFTTILQKTQHQNVSCTLINCLTDLCKKHTSCVASAIDEVANKTHDGRIETRTCALRSLRELIMHDYIKMRGRVMMKILFAVVDSDDDVSGKASLIVLKYIDEKNRNLLSTIFIELVFVCNGFLQHESLELSSTAEFGSDLFVLSGPEQLERRQLLYHFFIDNSDVVLLFSLLKNIGLIYDLLKKKKFSKSPEGTATLFDLLYVFEKICSLKGKLDQHEKKSDEPEAKQPRTSKKVSAFTHAVNGIEDVIRLLPQFARLAVAYDESLESPVESLASVVVANFGSSVESSHEFWSRFVKQTKTK